MAREAEVHDVQPDDGVLGAQPGVVALDLQPGSVALPAPTGVAAVVRRAGPRLLRDGLGPPAIFFTRWELIGPPPGILLALALCPTLFLPQRRRGTAAPGLAPPLLPLADH